MGQQAYILIQFVQSYLRGVYLKVGDAAVGQLVDAAVRVQVLVLLQCVNSYNTWSIAIETKM